jgi:hypothetical protein
MGDNGNNRVLPPTAPLTAEQAQKNFEKSQQEATKNLIASTSVTEVKDENGIHHFWMGFEVPEEMLPILGQLGSVAPNYISSMLKGGVYEESKKLAERFIKDFSIEASKDTSHKAGLATAAAVTGLLVGMQPISEVWQGISQRSRERDKVYKNLADVISTSDYKNNEVIQTALDRSNKLFSNGLRRAASELPIVAMNAWYAFKDHKNLAAEKTAEEEIKKGAALEVSEMSKLAAEIKKQNEEIAKVKTKYFRDHARVDIREKNFSEDKLKTEDAQKYKKYQETEKSWKDMELQIRKQERAKLRAEAEGKIGKNENEASPEAKLLMLNLVAGASQALKSSSSKKSNESQKTKCAYELIMALKKDFDNGNIREGSSITKQIVDIFQANEADRGRAHIGPALVAKFQPLAKRIGEVIASGELSPLALVNLVGNGQVMNHRRFVSEEDLEQIINKQRSVFASHDKTSLEDFLADFTKPEEIVAVLKDSLKELKGTDRAVLASLLPDDVLFNMGIKKDEVLALRRAGHEQMYGFLKKEIVNLSQETEEQLEKRGLSKEQVSAIKAAAERIEKGDEKDIRQIIEGSKDDKNNIVVSTVRKIELDEQISEPVKADCYWATKIKAQPRPKKIEEIIEDRETEQDIPKAEVIAHQKAQHGNSQHERLH